MRKSFLMKARFLSVLMMFAIVTAAISPACAFVNGGTSLIEICNAAGDVEIIAVSGSEAPTRPHQQTQHDCAFCFAADNQAGKAISNYDFSLYLTHQTLRVSAGLIVPAQLQVHDYHAQGPPISL